MSGIRSQISILPDEQSGPLRRRLITLSHYAVLYDDVSTAHLGVSAAYTLTEDDHTLFVDTTGGAVTITVPLAAAVPGREYCIKKTGVGALAVTLSRSGADTIEGGATLVFGAGARNSRTIKSDGVTSWWVISAF